MVPREMMLRREFHGELRWRERGETPARASARPRRSAPGRCLMPIEVELTEKSPARLEACSRCTHSGSPTGRAPPSCTYPRSELAERVRESGEARALAFGEARFGWSCSTRSERRRWSAWPRPRWHLSREGSVMLRPTHRRGSCRDARSRLAVGVPGTWLMRRRTTLSARQPLPVRWLRRGRTTSDIRARAWTMGAPLAAYGRRRGPPVPTVAARWRSRTSAPVRNFATTSWDAGGSGSPRPSAAAGERSICAPRANWFTSALAQARRYVSMTALGEAGPRLPTRRRATRLRCSARPARARRPRPAGLIAARTLAHHAALLVLDQKGDQRMSSR